MHNFLEVIGHSESEKPQIRNVLPTWNFLGIIIMQQVENSTPGNRVLCTKLLKKFYKITTRPCV